MKKIIFCSVIFGTFLNPVTYAQNGVINVFAGTGVRGFSGDGGPAVAAMLDTPEAMAFDRYGNAYISSDNRIRKVNTSGIISTIAGTGAPAYSGDGGPATAAELSWPWSIGVDSFGNIYFNDGSSRVRKINTSGIISTIAGTGSSGYGGDGGPATAAIFNSLNSIAVDAAGNVYISDGGNNRVRMVNTAGIINTIAGNGSAGFSGDGAAAILAKLNSPAGIALDHSGNLLIADRGNGRIRQVSTSGIISTVAGNGTFGTNCDGMLANLAPLYYPSEITVDKSNNIFIADELDRIMELDISTGRVTTIAGIGIGGVYGVNGFAYNASLGLSDMAIDSSDNLFVVGYGNSMVAKIKQLATVGLYIDANANCVMDNGEYYIYNPVSIQVDSDNITIDTISATSGFCYNTSGNPGDIYTFKTLTISGLVASCPSSGSISDTIHSLVNDYFTSNIGFQCSTISSFDLSVDADIPVTGINDQWGNIYIKNNMCLPTNATVTLNFSPKYVFTGDAHPLPASASGNTITWNLPDLSLNTIPYPVDLYYAIWDPSGDLSAGDTVHTQVIVTQITGDSNPTNNTIIIIDTVLAGVDPNEMSVSPSGYIPLGITTLQYTIGFENTGNDTAYNIYIIDSLSNNVDPKSFNILSTSATMNTTMLHSGSQNILKFDFPNINLLDSSHHGQCDGMVQFSINTNPGLPNGTTIFNHAGIYFDDNPVVLTNTVEDIIGTPSKVPVISSIKNIQLYPNPATDQLTIKTAQGAYNSCTITNTLGQVLIKQEINTPQTYVNIITLPAGLYYITLRGDNGSKVEKFVKM